MTMIHKTKLAIAIGAATLVAMAPEAAMAHKTSKKHTHHKAASSSSSSYTRSSSSSSAVDSRLRAMEDEISGLRAELGRAKTDVRTQGGAKVDEIEAQHQALEQRVAAVEQKEDNDLVFFRGGYAAMSHNRKNELLTSNPMLNGESDQSGTGWYVGAGFDHRLTNDTWGLTDLMAVDAELMFQYMNFGQTTNAFVSYQLNQLGMPGNIKNQVTQLTLAASPKLKFNLLDGTLRPWIIPFGLSVNIISPPSSGVTVLNPGLMLGTGIEYNVWKSLWVGADFRYNFTGGDLNYQYTNPNNDVRVLNKVSTDGLTAGGYIGFGF
jgi:opacity protein-like surface antigen